MARKTKKFADGGNARYDRKVKDIESDFAKWVKSGKYGNEATARAKMEQRMADAKDDLAKWTGADRTATRAAERAAEATLSEARRTKGMNIRNRDAAERFASLGDTPLSTKPVDIKPLKVSASRAPAPRAARPVTPRPAAPQQRQDASPAKLPEWVSRRGLTDYTKSPSPPATTQRPSNLEEIRRRGAGLRASFTGPPAQTTSRTYKPTTEDIIATDISGRKRNLTPEQRRKLEGAVARSGTRSPGFAKGGSIDGCAIRGKTRAPLKGKKR